MPELPEVECVRRSLSRQLLGRRIVEVRALRPDVIRGDPTPHGLLEGLAVDAIERHGKQLALIAGERVICVHLGMTGSLVLTRAQDDHAGLNHVHLIWRLDGGMTLRFRDPRRFGGVWTFPTRAELLAERWRRLGPDALAVTSRRLGPPLQRTQRALKAALLDQTILAGLGNIYVDECLFQARLSPLAPACELTEPEVHRLTRAVRRILRQAIDAGGSTLRDYVNGEGQPGGFQNRHRVYGRTGKPCQRCRRPLANALVAGRMTVWCERCQPRSGAPGSQGIKERSYSS